MEYFWRMSTLLESATANDGCMWERASSVLPCIKFVDVPDSATTVYVQIQTCPYEQTSIGVKHEHTSANTHVHKCTYMHQLYTNKNWGETSLLPWTSHCIYMHLLHKVAFSCICNACMWFYACMPIICTLTCIHPNTQDIWYDEVRPDDMPFHSTCYDTKLSHTIRTYRHTYK